MQVLFVKNRKCVCYVTIELSIRAVLFFVKDGKVYGNDFN